MSQLRSCSTGSKAPIGGSCTSARSGIPGVNPKAIQFSGFEKLHRTTLKRRHVFISELKP
jgi:hypothetical protein